MKRKQLDSDRLDRLVAGARRQRADREAAYRDQALKLFPWVCGRCGREFSRENVRELTVHHKDHDHDRNPPDGSNWELLCLYCHDNEHARHLDQVRGAGYEMAGAHARGGATHKPFSALESLLKKPDR
ncbi:MAG: HNH nuclease family protein [Gammaproteobacteria bacterium]|nr:HNH nuclease family protein [Gammaproteobacteria bacterium]